MYKNKKLEIMKKAIVVLIMIVGIFTSCEPQMCEDCETHTYYNQDGTIEYQQLVCIEYECPTTYNY